MHLRWSQLHWQTFAKFVVGGGINTAATYGLYWYLSSLFHYQIAYAISFAAGIALSYVLNLKLVFSARHSTRKAAVFPLVHLINYLCGAGIIHTVVQIIGLSPAIAPLIAIAVTVPLTFLLTRKVVSD